MRLPYVSNPPTFTSDSDNAIVQRVQARRGSRGLIPLDLALLHSPPVADGWNSFLGAIRTGTTLPASVLELAICRVAALNNAWYEWDAHAPLLQRADPALYTDAVMQYVLTSPAYAGHRQTDDGYGAADGRSGLGERELAVLAYTDAMTRSVEVPEAVWARMRAVFGEREMVEVTGVVAAYNCVSRFLVALDVGEKNGSR
ncbi:4-carboxymuconolactone decarboxylase [Pseudovirgaria hyperparasitica]|uniref:4-carboxymuconolactone decarboxylase n=1 Tax=Pseudovirgaria hyperparasitica TaxID=470096 RepID=A0A6A6WKE4_9PEZI|nr:4-carboxymuconolactone decarboxylase [Pseudovirgaria hyperparasitica]KAF2762655.1 4-carboxymuconolactone decarboxylase [Pseudovirgaria hyperparasitica]